MTSEFVSLGHPDKIADFISEYILDKFLEHDKKVRYAVEVQIKDNFVSLAGEITSTWVADDQTLTRFVKEAVEQIGYSHEYASKWPEGATLDADTIEVVSHISAQSPDIAQGVDNDGWGDQGIFWGMAVAEPNHDFLPADYWYAKTICQRLYDLALDGRGRWGLDIKTQVRVDEHNNPVECIVAAPMLPQHAHLLVPEVKGVVASVLGTSDCPVVVNGTGSYVRHASMADCGTTGRKLAVDFYGGNCRIGGGSPWTKDATKADLTLNLYARQLALLFLAEKKVKVCYVGISCSIGSSEVVVDFYTDPNTLVSSQKVKITPKEAIANLGLDKVSFSRLCREGLCSSENGGVEWFSIR